jgi:hypothetical protein
MKTAAGSKFMFGVRITDLNTNFLNLNAEKRYFDVFFGKVKFHGGVLESKEIIPL